MTSPVSHSCLLLALPLALFAAVQPHSAHAQEPEHSIGNFGAVSVSPAELQVTVDYNFAGDAGDTDVTIRATPEETGGVFDPRTVEFEEQPVESGTGSVTLTITKRAGAREFTSVAIRVCMSAPARALLCRDFPHTKTWTDAAAPPAPDEAGQAGPPEIISFVASTNSISRGDSVVLSWETSNAREVHLSGGAADASDMVVVPASGSQSVFPTRTTTFVLLASSRERGPQLMVQERLEVQVSATPTIFRFAASPATIRKGTGSTLTWDVYDSDRVTLDGTPVQARGDSVVTPQRTTSYTLKAWAGKEIVEEHATVSVSPFSLPNLSPPFQSVELCKGVDDSGDRFRCVSPDGPFWQRDKIHVIVRFENLQRGRYWVESVIYDSGMFGSGPLRRIHREESSFSNPRTGYSEIALEIPNSGIGVRKLELTVKGRDRPGNARDHRPPLNATSDIGYCVECPGHDEW